MVIDLDAARLRALAHRFDVATFQGNAASRRTLEDAGVRRAKLFIACTSRDETNLIAAIFGRMAASDATTIVRTTEVEYIEVWRERQLDIDFLVSSELETAHAVESIGVPPLARPTSSQTVRCRSSSSTSRRITADRTRSVPAAPRSQDPARLEGGRDHSWRRAAPSDRRRNDSGRGPDHRHRVTAGGARLERDHRAGGPADPRGGDLRRRPDGSRDRRAAARPGDRRPARRDRP